MIEWLKAYANGVGWAVGIIASTAGVIVAFWKLRIDQKRLILEERKLINEELAQKRKERESWKKIYDEAVLICEGGAHKCKQGSVLIKINILCHEARTLLPKEILKYLLEIRTKVFGAYSLLLESEFLREDLRMSYNEVNEKNLKENDKELREIEIWFKKQIEPTQLTRPIDEVFDLVTGLE